MKEIITKTNDTVKLYQSHDIQTITTMYQTETENLWGLEAYDLSGYTDLDISSQPALQGGEEPVSQYTIDEDIEDPLPIYEVQGEEAMHLQSRMALAETYNEWWFSDDANALDGFIELNSAEALALSLEAAL